MGAGGGMKSLHERFLKLTIEVKRRAKPLRKRSGIHPAFYSLLFRANDGVLRQVALAKNKPGFSRGQRPLATASMTYLRAIGNLPCLCFQPQHNSLVNIWTYV
eukprot:1347610-Amphidinium_carterae.1